MRSGTRTGIPFDYMPLTRRTFVLALPMLPMLARTAPLDAFQGLDQFASSAPPCTDDAKLTPGWPRDSSFKAGAPLRSRFVPESASGEHLTFSGTVTGVTCGRIAGARIDVWHADGRGAYDTTGFRHRGHQLTDSDGAFRFHTLMPGAVRGRAPRLLVRVVVTGKADFSTELFFPGHAANAADPRFREQLVVRLSPTSPRTASYDIILPL